MKQENYILKIIPLQPLSPSAPDYFFYFANRKIKNDSLIKIDFKNQDKIGYVYETIAVKNLKYYLKNLDYQLKPIKSVIIDSSPLTKYQKILAHKLSSRYYLSLSHAFYLFLGFYQTFNLPKIKTTINKSKKNFSLIINDKFPFNLIENKKAIIICPTLRETKIYYQQLKKKIKNLIYLGKIKNSLNYFTEIISDKKEVFIGNRNIIFLPWLNVEIIIVLKQGSIFYKEFFKTPKINYLELIEDYAKLLKCTLVYVDNFYSLDIYLKKKTLNLPKLEFKTFKNISNLVNLLKTGDSNKIFILQKNLGRKLICLNCYYQFECSQCGSYLTVFEDKLFCHYCYKNYQLIKTCPNCQEESFSIKTIGKQWLKNFLINNNFPVYEINTEQDLIKFEKNYKNNYVVLGSWHILNLKTINSFFINFDLGFWSENLFLKEKYLRLIYQLKESSDNLFIQTKLSADILNKIQNGLIIKEIINEREINNLPPFRYQVKIISRLSNLQELNIRLINLKEELKKRIILEKINIEITGPFLERIFKIKKRYQMYLLLKSDKYINLKKLLRGLRFFEEVKFDDYDF